VARILQHRYRLGRLLGTGAAGAVYRARDQELDRKVAVKLVPAERLTDADAVNRFKTELTILSRLRHPSIVEVLDDGVLPDGSAFIVMELVSGEDLRQTLSREGAMDAVRATEILTSACEGVEAAHREGVFHGDLKPENILLPDGGTNAKVLDFGLMCVTPAYMAPERIAGAAASARTDVFSLGVIAYELLSGALPFGRGTLADVVLAQSAGIPPMRAAGVSPAVERAVREALDADADRRPATPQAFAHLLNAAVRM
jgi:serine/threonine-protein kinase